MTVVPSGPLGFISAWPSGNPQPGASTLNAPTGTVVANAAIIPAGGAGTNGGVRVVATNPTDLIIDIDGYFAPPGAPGALSFYPVTPCRIMDTRDPVELSVGRSSQETRREMFPSSVAVAASRQLPKRIH
jgi:hypothetical protein